MLRLYRDVFTLALRRTAQSWLAAVSIPIYGAILILANQLLGPLGIAGGILLAMVAAACFAGYLYLLSEGVSGGKIQLADIKRGMRGMWDLISVGFVAWIFWMVIGQVGKQSPAIPAIAMLAVAFFLNVLPELLYTSRNGTFALFKESADFVMANPFAWFAPNLLFAFAALALTGHLQFHEPALLLVSLSTLASPYVIVNLVLTKYWLAPIIIIGFHFVMVFRGLLFRELSTSSARLRHFRAQF